MYKDKNGRMMNMKDLTREFLQNLCKQLKTNSGKSVNFSELQYKAWQHDEMSERKIAHAHILVNRVLSNGEVISDSYIGLKAKQTANEMDNKHNLKDADTLGKELKSTMKQRAFDALREAAKGRSKGAILQDINSNPARAFWKYAHIARQFGLELSLSRSSTGRVSGYYIQLDENENGYHHAYKASEIDRSLTLSRIANKFDKLVIEEEKRKQEEARKAAEVAKQAEEKRKQEEASKKQEEKKNDSKPELRQKPRWHRGL